MNTTHRAGRFKVSMNPIVKEVKRVLNVSQSFLPGYDGFIQGLNCNHDYSKNNFLWKVVSILFIQGLNCNPRPWRKPSSLDTQGGVSILFIQGLIYDWSQSFLPAMK